MIVLERPDYLDAQNLEAWVHLNRQDLIDYWCDCDEAIIAQGGPAASLNDFEEFCHCQWDQFNLAQFNDDEPLTEEEVRQAEIDAEDEA